MKFRIVLNAFCLLLAAASIVSAVAMADDAPSVERSPSPDGAAVGFSNLADGDVVPPTFRVVFSISGMGIAPAGAQIDNTGHHHLLIDLDELPDLDQPLPASDNLMHFGKGQSETELTLAEGEHTLQLLLADYRHIPHEPPVFSDVITITVSANAPAQEDKEED